MCNICCLFQCIVHFQRRCCCVSRDCCQCTPHAPSPFNDALAKVSALSSLLPGFVYLLQSFGELIRGNITENISLSLSVSNHHLIVYLWCTQGSFQNIIGKTYQTWVYLYIFPIFSSPLDLHGFGYNVLDHYTYILLKIFWIFLDVFS